MNEAAHYVQANTQLQPPNQSINQTIPETNIKTTCEAASIYAIHQPTIAKSAK